MSDRLFRLLERHQRLDDQLQRLQSMRRHDPSGPDPFEIARLKKLKLAIKDCITRKFQQSGAGSWRRMMGAR